MEEAYHSGEKGELNEKENEEKTGADICAHYDLNPGYVPGHQSFHDVRRVMYERNDFKLYKQQFIEIAAELGYGRDVIKEILSAKSEKEIDRIMTFARNRER